MNKTKTKKTAKIKKDHSENDFKDCDKLIINLCGRRVALDKGQQKEILEFIYAISSDDKIYTDPGIAEGISEAEKLRNAMFIKIKKAIYNMPVDILIKFAKRLFIKEDVSNMTVN